jgi:hypothetical protein
MTTPKTQRLPSGKVVADGKAVHVNQPATVRVFQHVNFRPDSDPLRVAIARALYG